MRFYRNIGIRYRLIAYIGSLIITIGINKYYTGKKQAIKEERLVCIYMFVLYIALTFFATTITRTVQAERIFKVKLFAEHALALNGNAKMAKQVFFNILMMIPFGLLLPAVTGGRCGIGKTLCGAFLYSLTIEIVQLVFRFGSFETDDLLNNCIGALIGYGLYALCCIIYRQTQDNLEDPQM